MRKTIFLGTALFLFVGCKSENERRIVGKWQALQLMECENVIPIQTELVDIEFMSNGKYIFHSTLNIKEEGNYHIRKNFLFTQDKMREKAPEKAVLIQSIEDDTLVLQMSYKGKDQWLTLVKEGVTEKVNKDAKAVANVNDKPAEAVSSSNLTTNSLDSIQKAEEKKKQEIADKEAERKKEEAAADKKREAEADRKREAAKKESSKMSPAEAYKKREAKRIAEERAAKEEAQKRAAKFRKEYAQREAERKKREARKN
jgi:uncharacterized protein YcfL